MAKFKSGDRVRLLDSFCGAAKPGAEAVVGVPAYTTDSGGYTRYLSIQWDANDPLVNGQSDGGYYDERFELVAPKKKKSQAYRGNGKHGWEQVTADDTTYRLRVPGGYLYRRLSGIVFVPMPEVVKHKV